MSILVASEQSTTRDQDLEGPGAGRGGRNRVAFQRPGNQPDLRLWRLCSGQIEQTAREAGIVGSWGIEPCPLQVNPVLLSSLWCDMSSPR